LLLLLMLLLIVRWTVRSPDEPNAPQRKVM
jgi:hypothetical protein